LRLLSQLPTQLHIRFTQDPSQAQDDGSHQRQTFKTESLLSAPVS
jgi:hypothetical protein